LGAGEIDEKGNVNVSRLGPIIGQGGFIDITYKAKALVFCLEFVGGAQYKIGDGKLIITKEGQRKKFVKQVAQITYPGEKAWDGQKIKVVTERAVMERCNGKWTITEVAPGINLQTDVLQHMDFAPDISKDLVVMDHKIFL